jgi:hypothetical protein
LRRINDAQRNAVFLRLLNHFRIVRIEEHVQLTLVQVFLVLGAGRLLNRIRVVQQHAKVTNTPDARLRADRRLTRFNTRVAEDTFLGFAALPVVVLSGSRIHIRQPRHLS